MHSIHTFFAQLSTSNGPGLLATRLPIQFEVASAGPFPLAKHVPVEGNAIGGALMIGFDKLSFGPLAVARLETCVAEPGHTGEFTVTLAPAQVQGHYELFAMESPRIDLDTGGAVQPFGALEAMQEAPAGAGQGVTEAQYDQVMQANGQRSRLSQTANGRSMLAAYDQYNDDYNDVFNTQEMLRQHWQGNGAVAEMSDYTSAALDSGAVVNPPDKLFGTNPTPYSTYNSNAFAQKLNVWAACMRANYLDAAAAALKFGTSLSTTTGNTQTTTVPMTGDQVYTSVNSASPTAFTATLLEPAAEHPLHSAMLHIVQGTHDERHLKLLANHGFELRGYELKAVQEIYAGPQRLGGPAARLPIAQGNCAVALDTTTFRFRVLRQPDGGITVKLVDSTFSLDALDFGAAQWPGEAGAVARERLAGASFLRGILEDRLTSKLTRLLRGLAAPFV